MGSSVNCQRSFCSSTGTQSACEVSSSHYEQVEIIQFLTLDVNACFRILLGIPRMENF